MSSRLTARAFRRRVLRPAEGVFLFHPRMLQRLVRRHLGEGSSNLAIPLLRHYLMPRKIFRIGLEDENPDVLSVIEGLNLPSWVILLPAPSSQELAVGAPEHWLRDYWGRRFEAEVARAWQVARHDNQDQEAFGAQGLAQRIGERGFRVASPEDPDLRGGTIVIDVQPGPAIVAELAAREILVDYRPEAGIRVSPHFYTRDEDLIAFLDEVRSILDTRAYEKHVAKGAAY